MTKTYDDDNLRGTMPKDVFEAHAHSINNRSEIEKSKMCGCFHCLNIFEVSKIEEWIRTGNDDEMAMCPYCGIDSLLADNSGYPITAEFMNEMNKHWFGGDHPDVGPHRKF